MEKLSLTVMPREATGKKVRALRTQGKIPAVLYGHGITATNVMVEYQQFEKVYTQAGESTLVDLSVDGKPPVKALIYDVTHDPVSNQFTHVDFHQVRMDEKLTANVPLKFIGDAPAVKELSAIFVTQLDELEIRCLPGDLVHEIEVDISNLKQFDDAVHVSDVVVPKGIEVLNQPDTVVAVVQEPRSEKEVEAAAGAAPEATLPAEVAGEAAAGGDQEAGATPEAEK